MTPFIELLFYSEKSKSGFGDYRIHFFSLDCAAYCLHVFEDEFPTEVAPRHLLYGMRKFMRMPYETDEDRAAHENMEKKIKSTREEVKHLERAIKGRPKYTLSSLIHATACEWNMVHGYDSVGRRGVASVFKDCRRSLLPWYVLDEEKSAVAGWQHARLAAWFSKNEPDDWEPRTPKGECNGD